ncbi:MAG TPA: hypothetical protein VK961_14215 [Chthoniobacter sp.]|nr:hypothetical protein [Chthoniobacter sp.]
MKPWLLPLLGLCAVSSSFAAVGETRAEVEKRFGAPVINIPLAAPFKGVTVMNYEFQGMYVAVAFLDGKVVQEHYMKRDEAVAFTQQEVTDLLSAHALGKNWVAKTEPDAARRMWLLEDKTLLADLQPAPRSSFDVSSTAYLMRIMEEHNKRE